MPTSLPQTYLIILGSLLFILAIVVGRQVFKVRRNEMNLVNLERDGAINSTDSAKLYELGSAQLNKRLYPQATNTLKNALSQIKDEPEDARAIIENALGFSLAAQDNFNAAIKHYKNAIKAKPNYPVALNNLAFAKQKLSQKDEAYEIYRKVLEIEPKNKTASRQIKNIDKINKNGSDRIIYKKGF